MNGRLCCCHNDPVATRFRKFPRVNADEAGKNCSKLELVSLLHLMQPVTGWQVAEQSLADVGRLVAGQVRTLSNIGIDCETL